MGIASLQCFSCRVCYCVIRIASQTQSSVMSNSSQADMAWMMGQHYRVTRLGCWHGTHGYLGQT